MLAFSPQRKGRGDGALPARSPGARVTVCEQTLIVPLIGGSLALFLATLLLWPVAALIGGGMPGPCLWPLASVPFRLSRLVAFWRSVASAGGPADELRETNVAYIGNGLNPWLVASHITRLARRPWVDRAGEDRGEFWKTPDSAGGLGSCDAAPARQRRIHYIRLVDPSAEPIAEVLSSEMEPRRTRPVTC